MGVQLLSTQKAHELSVLAPRYKQRVKQSKSWKKMSSDELWLTVLSQVVVPGRASAGETLVASHEARQALSFARLTSIQDDKALQQHIHRVFAAIGTRWAGQSWESDAKAARAAHNLRVLQGSGPKEFFRDVARCGSTAAMVSFLREPT